MKATFLELVKRMDNVPYYYDVDEHAAFRKSVYTLISHDGTFRLGYILPIVAEALKDRLDAVKVDDNTREIRIIPSLNTLELRTKKFNEIAKDWKDSNKFSHLKGWRSELYTIYDTARNPYMRLERACCPLLGIIMYGCHINGYVRIPGTGEIKFWVPRRSPTKQTYPGMLDETVAGGMGYPYGCLETVLKECHEEAGFEPEYVAKHVKPIGAISYFYQPTKGDFKTENGCIQPEIEYVYDLELDPSIIPHPVDHEAEDFRLMGMDEVVSRMRNGEFKYNCAGVLIDFFIRHGLLTPEDEPDYIEIMNRLHRKLPFPTR